MPRPVDPLLEDAMPPLAAGPARDELARLARSLLERERQTSRRLGHVLHDELGQTLAALRLHWEACRNAAAEQREAMDARIADLVVLANRQVRSVLAELRPPLLDELGLAAALDNEIRQHPGPGVELRAEDSAQLRRWPADVEYAAFMIAREALQTAQRHAAPGRIRVELDGDEGFLVLGIADAGPGLAPQDDAGQLGLIGMRGRALAIGGHLDIDARPGHGTMVTLTWTPPDE